VTFIVGDDLVMARGETAGAIRDLETPRTLTVSYRKAEPS
jgi:hypothetical protein